MRKHYVSFEPFDKVYCIHLPNDERKQAMEQEFARVGITDVQYVHAARPAKRFTMSNMRRNAQGEMGVNLSQIKAVVQSIADGAERPLIVEDDIVFAPNAVEQLEAAWNELPLDWDLLYLGGHPTGRIFDPQAWIHGAHTAKVGMFSFAEAYAFNNGGNKRFFDMWCDQITGSDAMYDFILGRFSKENNSYCAYPLVTKQRPIKSQISGQFEDKSSLVARAWTHHLGDENACAEHLELALKWRKENPSKWRILQQRKKTGKL